MKLKMILTTLAMTFAASTATAEVPGHVQKQIREIEHLDKMDRGGAKKEKGAKSSKAKSKAVRGAPDQEEARKGNRELRGRKGETTRGKSGERVDRRKEVAGKPSPLAPQTELDDPIVDPKRVKPAVDKRKPDKTGKRNDKSRSAKGLTIVEKEERKHLWRLARIERIEQIASERSNAPLLEKAKMLRLKESLRYERAMDRLMAE